MRIHLVKLRNFKLFVWPHKNIHIEIVSTKYNLSLQNNYALFVENEGKEKEQKHEIYWVNLLSKEFSESLQIFWLSYSMEPGWLILMIWPKIDIAFSSTLLLHN